MVPEVLVMLAADAGLLSVLDIEVMLIQLSRTRHRDQTSRELEDALLDARAFLISRAAALAITDAELTPT
jgi:hypothetical protein